MTSIEEGIIFQIPHEGSVEVTYKFEDTRKLSNLPQITANNIADALKNIMSSALASVEDDLTYALANANRLCLPTTGTFFMEDPIFNQKGGLLVTLAYDWYFACLFFFYMQYLTLETGPIHHHRLERANTNCKRGKIVSPKMTCSPSF